MHCSLLVYRLTHRASKFEICLPASVEVGLQQQTYSTFEGAGSVDVCVRIERGGFPTTEPFNLLVSTQDGSAS